MKADLRADYWAESTAESWVVTRGERKAGATVLKKAETKVCSTVG